MCISLVAPKRSVRIIYGSESVWFVGKSGLLEIVADILVQNESTAQIDLLWCIVPQCLFHKDGFIPVTPTFSDISDDLVKTDSQYTRGLAYRLTEDNGRPWVKLTLPNPTQSTVDMTYEGTFYGGSKTSAISRNAGQRALMTQCMFGVFRIDLNVPIATNESRWMRLKMCPLTGPKEQRNDRRLISDYLTNRLTLSYNVAGPAKVRYDARISLKNLQHELLAEAGDGIADGILCDMKNLQDSLILQGLEDPSTRVVIGDWRTRFFQSPMERFMSLQTEGAVRIVGSQPKIIKTIDDAYYEWGAGKLQVQSPPPGVAHGYFVIRFVTKYVPRAFFFVPVLTILSFVLAVLAIVLTLFLSCPRH